MLYTKNINDITFKNIEEFCKQQIPENLYLDYKEEINPNSLPKTIASMANTFGGLIIIGVEDEDSKPKLPITGINFREGVREQINNLILSNITPPSFPEVQVCKSEDGSKMLVVIRIAQSNITPHATMKNTRVYVRTFVSNEPIEDMATLDKIEWLKDRRDKSIQLRDSFYAGAEERYTVLCNRSSLRQNISQISLSSSPLFPHNVLIAPDKLQGVINKIKTQWIHTEIPSSHDNIYYKPFHSGIYNFSPRSAYKRYNELNQYGFYLHLHDFPQVLRKEHSEGETETVGHLLTILCNLVLFIESAEKFYKEIGYWGLISLKINIDKLLEIDGIYRLPAPRGRAYIHNENIKPIDDEILLIHECLVSDLDAKGVDIVTDLFCKIAWSLGFTDIGEEQVITYLKENGRIS